MGLKKRATHMIMPGHEITPNRMVRAYCMVLDTTMNNVTTDSLKVTCGRCTHLLTADQKKFAQNENFREAQEG